MKLNNVYTTIVLYKSQISKAKSLKNSILLYGNVIQDLSNRAAELKKEEKEIINILKKEKLCAKKDRIEISKMENDLRNIKTAIKDEMIKKFKTITNWNFLDQMEMTIIDYMIIKSKSEAKDSKERFIRELKILEVLYNNKEFPFKIHIKWVLFYKLLYFRIKLVHNESQ